MSSTHLILLLVMLVGQCLALLVLLWRRGRHALGYAAILSAGGGLAGWALARGDDLLLFYLATAAFSLSLVIPMTLGWLVKRALGRGDLDRAVRLVKARRLLQPGAGLEQQQRTIEVLASMRSGHTAELLAQSRAHLADDLNPALRTALVEQILHYHLYARQYGEVAELFIEEGGEALASVSPVACSAAARAFLELDRLVEASQCQARLEHTQGRALAALLNQARLTYLAHLGRIQEVESLLAVDSGFLQDMPDVGRLLWQGVALARSGDAEGARALWKEVAARDEHPDATAAAEARLRNPPTPLTALDALPWDEMDALAQQVTTRAQAFQSMPRHQGRLWQIAPLTSALLGILILIHLAVEAAGSSQEGWNLTRFGANFVLATIGGEPWRLVTSMFLHAGALHLLVNCYALFVLGRLVEQLFGSARFWIVYLLAGVAGSLASAYVGEAYRLSVGASGAIFGLLGAALVGLMRLRGFVPEQWRKQVTYNLLIVLALNLYIGHTMSQVDNSAHVGGLLGGGLLSLLLSARGVRDRPARWMGLAALSLVGVTLLCGAMAATSSPARMLTNLPSQEILRGGLKVRCPAHWIPLESKDAMFQDPLLELSPTLRVLQNPSESTLMDLHQLAREKSDEILQELALDETVKGARLRQPSPITEPGGAARSEIQFQIQGRPIRLVSRFWIQDQILITAVFLLPEERAEAYQPVIQKVSVTLR